MFSVISNMDLAVFLLLLVIPQVLFFIFPDKSKSKIKTENENETKNETKIHIFHHKTEKEIITVAYQLNIPKNQLIFARVKYKNKPKNYYQKLIDALNPISLHYLQDKEKLEQEMHQLKTWNRKVYANKAKIRLSQKPNISTIPVKDLSFQDYRNLEKFLIKLF
jgi:hypothetical protein